MKRRRSEKVKYCRRRLLVYSIAIAPMTRPIRAPGTFRAAAPPTFGTLVGLPVEVAVAVDEALEVLLLLLLLEVAEAEADEDEAEAEAELDLVVEDAAAEEDDEAGVVVVIRVVDDAALLPVEEAEADVPVEVAEVTLAVPEAPAMTKRGKKFTSLGSESSVIRMVKSGCAARSAGTFQV